MNFFTSTKFDFLEITESSKTANEDVKSKVEIEGYDTNFINHEVLPIKRVSTEAGTALYFNNNFTIFERIDLKTQYEDFESTWGEIKNKKSCLYRQPIKLVKEKKKVYLERPIQIGISVYSYAKQSLLSFWEFINHFLDNDLYELIECTHCTSLLQETQ